jgi:hypothetical protein
VDVNLLEFRAEAEKVGLRAQAGQAERPAEMISIFSAWAIF